MTDEFKSLNIEQARDALTRVRHEQYSSAVRSPRPADLSRLEESLNRRHSIDAHSTMFRDKLRQKFDLSEYRGPQRPTSSYVGQMMSSPVCDADMCMPINSHKNTAVKSVDENVALSPQEFSEPQSESLHDSQTESLSSQDTNITEVEQSITSPENIAVDKPVKPKRRKFLGLF